VGEEPFPSFQPVPDLAHPPPDFHMDSIPVAPKEANPDPVVSDISVASHSADGGMLERLTRLEAEMLEREAIWQERERELKEQFEAILEGRETNMRMLENEIQTLRTESETREAEYSKLQEQYEAARAQYENKEGSEAEKQALYDEVERHRAALHQKALEMEAADLQWAERESQLKRQHHEELERLKRELSEIRNALENEMNDVHRALDVPLVPMIEVQEPVESDASQGRSVDDSLMQRFWEKLEHMDSELHEIDTLLRQFRGGSPPTDNRELEKQRKWVNDLQVLLSEREQKILELERALHSAPAPTDVPTEAPGEDDLSQIRGIGVQTKEILEREFGIRTFRQLAELPASTAQNISKRLRFQGRIHRDNWMGQARELHQKKYGRKKPAGGPAPTPDGSEMDRI
jgi:predicted flap endonuclease-1-like 5' DNA nuclease/cytochrome c556